MKKLCACSMSLILFFMAWSVSGAEPDILTIESTITGSQEQPKVMVIVPWKAPTGPEGLQDFIIAGLIEKQIMVPIDREVFLRRLGYFQQLKPAVNRSILEE